MGTDVVSVRRALAAVAAALLCSPLLAACSDDEPEPLVVEPPPSPTASATAEPVPEPEPWQVRSKAGAVAFVEHWVEVFNEATATGRTTDLRALATSACRSCDNFAVALEELYGGGGQISSKGWLIEEVAVTPDSTRRVTQGALNILRTPQTVARPDGATERFNGGRATMSFTVEWRRGGWRMLELVLL